MICFLIGQIGEGFYSQVDTVNDCHMIASGVPEKNGDKHAPEIATMALDLLVKH
jgi:guanylate cyclase 2D/E/F